MDRKPRPPLLPKPLPSLRSPRNCPRDWKWRKRRPSFTSGGMFLKYLTPACPKSHHDSPARLLQARFSASLCNETFPPSEVGRTFDFHHRDPTVQRGKWKVASLHMDGGAPSLPRPRSTTLRMECHAPLTKDWKEETVGR